MTTQKPRLFNTLALGALLSCTVLGLGALPSCTTPPLTPSPSPSVFTPPAEGPESSSAQAGSEELSDERDLVTYEVMADEAGATQYRLQQVTTSATASVVVKRPAQALVAAKLSALGQDLRDAWLARRQAWRASLQSRFAALGDDKAKLLVAYQGTPWVSDNLAGTKFKTFTFSINRSVSVQGQARNLNRVVTITRTVSADERIILVSRIDTQSNWSDGTSRTSSWGQSLQADGRLASAYTADMKTASGVSREVTWNKSINVADQITGSGQLVAQGPSGSNRSRSYLLSLGGTRNSCTLSLSQAGISTLVEVRLPYEGSATANSSTGAASSALSVTADAALGVDASL